MGGRWRPSPTLHLLLRVVNSENRLKLASCGSLGQKFVHLAVRCTVFSKITRFSFKADLVCDGCLFIVGRGGVCVKVCVCVGVCARVRNWMTL